MKDAPSGQVVGVDVGGTFTDLVVLDQVDGTVRLAKVPSTMENQAFGVLAALDEAKADYPNLDLIIHGTTTTTNAVPGRADGQRTRTTLESRSPRVRFLARWTSDRVTRCSRAPAMTRNTTAAA